MEERSSSGQTVRDAEMTEGGETVQSTDDDQSPHVEECSSSGQTVRDADMTEGGETVQSTDDDQSPHVEERSSSGQTVRDAEMTEGGETVQSTDDDQSPHVEERSSSGQTVRDAEMTEGGETVQSTDDDQSPHVEERSSSGQTVRDAEMTEGGETIQSTDDDQSPHVEERSSSGQTVRDAEMTEGGETVQSTDDDQSPHVEERSSSGQTVRDAEMTEGGETVQSTDDDQSPHDSCVENSYDSDDSESIGPYAAVGQQKEPPGRIRDEANESIYLKTSKKSMYTLTGKVKRTNRVWDRYHYCYFCSYTGSNISKHLRSHEDESEIAAILQDKHVSWRLQIIRNKGDNKHNLQVLEEKEGELVLARRPSSTHFDVNDYGPCPSCYLWVKEDCLSQHQRKRCIVRNLRKIDKSSIDSLVMQSRILKGAHSATCGSKRLHAEVIEKMRAGEIRTAAKNDPLICLLGEEWLLKATRNPLRRGNYASDHMRRAAKLLLECRKLDESIETMADCLCASKIDILIQAAGNISTQSDQSDSSNLGDTLTTPSVPLKLQWDIQRMVESKEVIGIKNDDAAQEREAGQFLKVFNKEWPRRLARPARALAEERRIQKTIAIPGPEDLKRFSLYLQGRIAKLDFSIRGWTKFSEVASLIQARLATYNKRRPGEVEALR